MSLGVEKPGVEKPGVEKPGPEPRPNRTEQPAPPTRPTRPTPPAPPLQSAQASADATRTSTKDLKPQSKPNRNRNKRKSKTEDQSLKLKGNQNQDRNPDQIQNPDATVRVQSHNYPASLNTRHSLRSADRSRHASSSSLPFPAVEVTTPSLNPQSIGTPDNPPPAPRRITEEEQIAIITRIAEKEAKASIQREADTADMAARANRPRPGPSREDPAAAQEETSMWNQIVADLKICDSIKEKASELVNQVIDLERIIGKSPTSAQENQLDAMYREIVRLTEEEKRILHEEPHDVIKNLGILRALRAASEIEPRNAPPSKSRNQKNKPPKPEMDGAADSPGPSPSMATSATKLKGSSIRSGSVPSIKDAKEISIKIEEGSEGSKGPVAERMGKLILGAEVAYKQAKMREDGSQWIQCNIINITDGGNKKRYEVQDPEPDEGGAPGQIYKTTAASMIAIPTPDSFLVDYPVGKHVLARYPETTTFYRAEVTAIKKDIYQLKFEDDQNQEMEVARRYVLDLGGR